METSYETKLTELAGKLSMCKTLFFLIVTLTYDLWPHVAQIAQPSITHLIHFKQIRRERFTSFIVLYCNHQLYFYGDNVALQM